MLQQILESVRADGSLLAATSLVIFLAAIVRGFSGFGFSLLTITALSVLMPISQVIPSIFMLEIAASINLLPGIWREIQWRSIAWLLLGYVLALPLGVMALANFPAPPMQLALSIFVIATSTLMLRGFSLKRTPGRLATTTTGAVSGLLNGAFGIGGPPVILFYFSTPAAVAAGRASIIAFFLSTDAIGLVEMHRNDFVTQQSFVQSIVWLPALVLGVWAGAHGFKRMDQAKFRRAVLFILLGLAMLVLVKALDALAGFNIFAAS
jgi:uncharacterized protein